MGKFEKQQLLKAVQKLNDEWNEYNNFRKQCKTAIADVGEKSNDKEYELELIEKIKEECKRIYFTAHRNFRSCRLDYFVCLRSKATFNQTMRNIYNKYPDMPSILLYFKTHVHEYKRYTLVKNYKEKKILYFD